MIGKGLYVSRSRPGVCPDQISSVWRTFAGTSYKCTVALENLRSHCVLHHSPDEINLHAKPIQLCLQPQCLAAIELAASVSVAEGCEGTLDARIGSATRFPSSLQLLALLGVCTDYDYDDYDDYDESHNGVKGRIPLTLAPPLGQESRCLDALTPC